jgi:hypothetical protein
MNNEQQQIINEVYENYWDIDPDADKTFQYEGHTIETRRMTKDEFVFMVKIDGEYGRRWGLKIEERELTWDESNEYYNNHQSLKVPYLGLKVPTRLITITYNNKTIVSYE